MSRSGLDARLSENDLDPRETGEALRERGGAGGDRTGAGIAGRGNDDTVTVSRALIENALRMALVWQSAYFDLLLKK